MLEQRTEAELKLAVEALDAAQAKTYLIEGIAGNFITGIFQTLYDYGWYGSELVIDGRNDLTTTGVRDTLVELAKSAGIPASNITLQPSSDYGGSRNEIALKMGKDDFEKLKDCAVKKLAEVMASPSPEAPSHSPAEIDAQTIYTTPEHEKARGVIRAIIKGICPPIKGLDDSLIRISIDENNLDAIPKTKFDIRIPIGMGLKKGIESVVSSGLFTIMSEIISPGQTFIFARNTIVEDGNNIISVTFNQSGVLAKLEAADLKSPRLQSAIANGRKAVEEAIIELEKIPAMRP